jgi:hypothetical protein
LEASSHLGYKDVQHLGIQMALEISPVVRTVIPQPEPQANALDVKDLRPKPRGTNTMLSL